MHRDVKPANVLIDRQDGREHAYLTDFGDRAPRRGNLGAHADRLGHRDDRLPGARADRRGRRRRARRRVRARLRPLPGAYRSVPYPRDHDVAKMYAHLNAPVPDARELDETVPDALAELAMRAMAKEPDDRIDSAAELAERLVEAADTRVAAAPATLPAPPPIPEAPPTKRAPTRRGGAADGAGLDETAATETAPPRRSPPTETAPTAIEPAATGPAPTAPAPTEPAPTGPQTEPPRPGRSDRAGRYRAGGCAGVYDRHRRAVLRGVGRFTWRNGNEKRPTRARAAAAAGCRRGCGARRCACRYCCRCRVALRWVGWVGFRRRPRAARRAERAGILGRRWRRWGRSRSARPEGAHTGAARARR